MRRPFLACVLLVGVAACARDEGIPPDVAAARAITMSGAPISWEELDVHPALVAHACAVSTLVNRHGTPVGYCDGGRRCRTMDWRPVADGCPRIQRAAAQF